MAVDRLEVERRGMLAAEAVVPCLCMFIVVLLFEVKDLPDCEELEGTREWPWRPEVEEVDVRKDVEG